ncbi:hypothetical protein QJQ45_021738 [Haematococcus lacustris]|nr:hypothetical protein QJQ45_021738 [Haematococcus lacustris]
MSKAMRRRIGFVLQPVQARHPGQDAMRCQQCEKICELSGDALSDRPLGICHDDVLYETLTVLETLTYAGLLRLPNAMSRADKRARVDAVIEVLGLSKSRDTIIGGYFKRGVSGGERKRVSVGHELLINPAVLMLDEPTSGLDSTTALHLVTLLRDLASGGRAILTTIHQPSSRLYRQLDQVMLLAEGHIMYYGDALRAVDWFDHLGFSLPYGTNLADHILDCAMGEVTHDPSAPGAAQAAASCGVSTHSDEQEDARASRRQQYVKKMRGPVAVRALYTTYESWYLGHPGGFTVSMDQLEEGDEGSLHEAKAAGRGGPLGGALGGQGRLKPQTSGDAVGAMLVGVRLVVPRRSQQICGTLAAGGLHGGPATDLCPGGSLPDSPSPPTAALPPNKARPLPLSHPLPKTISATSEAGGKAGGAGGAGLVRDGAPFWQQVAVLWQRAAKVRRFESLSGQNLVQMFLVAAITGLLWWQRGRNGDVAGAADVLGLLFFELMFPSFRTLFASLFTFPDEYRMLTKERPSGMYKLSAYYIARTGADLPIEILYPTLFVVVVYWFGGLRPEAGAFFGNWLSILLVVLVAQAWGLLFGGLFMVPKTAQTVTTVIMLSLMLVGGYFVRDVPGWIGWLRFLSFVYWGNNLLTKIQFRHISLTDCSQLGPNGGCLVVTDLQTCLPAPVELSCAVLLAAMQSALRLTVDPNEAVYPEVLVLLAMLIILRWATYIVLRWKTTSSQRNL